MAKNWQYGRLQAVALQVVMCLILVASLGLAAFIDHRRSGALDVRMGKLITDGRLVLRLPEDWEVLIKQKPGPSADPPPGSSRTLTLIDFDRQGRERRRLRITQEQQTERKLGPEYYLEKVLTVPPNVLLEPQPFPMLGQDDAVLIPLMLDRRIARMFEQSGGSAAGLYACAVLPDGLAVTVQLTGDGTYGPTSRQLLRQVADSLRLADVPSATAPSATAPSATAPSTTAPSTSGPSN